MTESTNGNVEICEDMSCIIMNEVSRETANLLLENLDKKPRKGNVCIVEQYYMYSPKDLWWIATLENNKKLETCDKW